jgi:hypothetical protein
LDFGFWAPSGKFYFKVRYPENRDAVGTRLQLQILPSIKQNFLALASKPKSKHALSLNTKQAARRIIPGQNSQRLPDF